MKKFAFAAVALCLVLFVAAPAMALEITTDGYFRARGISVKDYAMDDTDDTDATDSYYEMRLRVNNEIIVSDKLSLVTRFRALNRDWGTADDGKQNFDWERAFMVVKTPFGVLSVGRMQGGTWGTTFRNTEGDVDRIKFQSKVGPVIIGGIIEQSAENDGGNFNNGDVSADQDTVLYMLYFVYLTRQLNAGSIFIYVDSAASSPTYKTDYFIIMPYFKLNLGMVNLQGEVRWDTGTAVDFKNDALDDRDMERLAANIEANVDLGPVAVQAGYAYASGDDDPTDDKVENSHFGDDWEKTFILASSTGVQAAPGALGGIGNLSQNGGNPHGAHFFYAGADMSPMENLSIGLIGAVSWAANEPSGVDDYHGWEVNLTLGWKIYDNLEYTFIAAYLDAGDYWEDVAPKADFQDSTYAFYHQLRLNF